ncbi:MAG TPA: AsmA family protein, partial [Burkholderiaceae bacterium]|nr:AsmA family protein [Burkholderiaceae bacterium]
YLGGSFSEPIVSVDKKTVAMRAGGALALGVLSPFATMVPLVDVAPSKESGCAQLIHEAKSKSQAPVSQNTPPTKNSQIPREN